MDTDTPKTRIEQQREGLELIYHSEGTAIERSGKIEKWITDNEAMLEKLGEKERAEIFDSINRHVGRELQILFAKMKPILKSLESDLDACYRDELSDEQLIELQKKIYAAFSDLTESEGLNDLASPADVASLYRLTDITQAIASPIMRIAERYSSEGGSLSVFLHDIAGKEMHGIQGMGMRAELREFSQNQKNAPEKASAYVKWQNGLIRCSGIGILKFLACTELLAWRLDPETKLRQDTFDLKNLVEKTGESQSVRFNFKEKLKLTCEVNAEEGTNTIITASEEMVYIIFMNIIKNAGKIMAERKIPEADQKVEINLFERDNILFVHYTDRIGGLDITKLYQSAVARVREITKNKAGELLPYPPYF